MECDELRFPQRQGILVRSILASKTKPQAGQAMVLVVSGLEGYRRLGQESVSQPKPYLRDLRTNGALGPPHST